MDVDSVETGFSLVHAVDNKKILGNFFWKEGNKKFIFETGEEIDYNSKYLVTLSKNIKDKYGTSIKENFSASFKTRKKPVNLIKHESISSLWRSALIPGWGQYYYGNNRHAITFLSLFTVSFVGLIYSSMDYAKKDSDYVNALNNYNQAQKSGKSQTELNQMYNDLTGAYNSYNSSRTRFVVFSVTTGLIYLGNLASAYLLPKYKIKDWFSRDDIKVNLIAYKAREEKFGLVLSKIFCNYSANFTKKK